MEKGTRKAHKEIEKFLRRVNATDAIVAFVSEQEPTGVCSLQGEAQKLKNMLINLDNMVIEEASAEFKRRTERN